MPTKTLGSAYLDFLRNLTPQIVLLSLAFVAIATSKTGNLTDLSATTLIFIIGCIIASLAAIYFNIDQFLSAATDPTDDYLTERTAHYIQNGKGKLISHWLAVVDICIKRPGSLLLTLGIMVACVTVPLIVLVLSLFNAASIWKAILAPAA